MVLLLGCVPMTALAEEIAPPLVLEEPVVVPIQEPAEASTELPVAEAAVVVTNDAAAAVAAPKVTITSQLSTGVPRLTWKAVDGAVSYQVWMSTTGKAGSFKLLYTTKNLACNHVNAVAGTKYYYKVRAVLAGGVKTAYSGVVSRVSDLPRPTGVKITSNAATGKNVISWKAVSGAVKYQVWSSKTGKDGSFTLLMTTKKLTHTHNGAVAGTKYYYKVKAVHTNTNANSAFSVASYRVCDLARPTIEVAPNDTGKPVITWKAVSGAAKYQVWASKTGKDGSFTLLNTLKTLTHTHKAAAADTTYYYKVKAIHTNTNANSAFSLIQVFSPSQSGASRLEQPVVTISNDAATGKPLISWEAVADAEGYEIWSSATNAEGSFTLLHSTTELSFLHSDTVTANTYYYKVRAVHSNADSNSYFSTALSAVCHLPQPVVSLSVDSWNGKILVSWEPVEGAASYNVLRSDSEDGTYTLFLNTTETSTKDFGITAGVKYYYKVRAMADLFAASSDFSEIKSETCDLPQPKEVKVTIDEVSGKPKISWAKVDGAVKYGVYRSTAQDGKYALINTVTGTSTINKNAVPGTKYYYKVMAIAENPEANSGFSSAFYNTCLLAQPAVTLSNESPSGKVKLTWDAVEGAAKYWIWRSETKDGTYEIIMNTTETSFADGTADTSKTYYYCVSAVSPTEKYNSKLSAPQSGQFKFMDFTVSIALNTDNEPRLTWNLVKNATGYKVYRSFYKAGPYTEMTQTDAAATAYTNFKAARGLTFYYKVEAVNASGTVLAQTATPLSIAVPAPTGEVKKTQYVYVPSVNLYDKPSTATTMTEVLYMDEVQVGAAASTVDGNSWLRVFYNGKLYYTYYTGVQKFTDTKSTFQYTGNTEYQQKAIDYAMYICQNWKTYYINDINQSNGIPDADGRYGFDCSGYVSYVLNTIMEPYAPAYRITGHIGNLYDMANIYNDGLAGELNVIDVALNDIQPGDVIFFDRKGTGEIDHCGIYLGKNAQGEGEFAHANADSDRYNSVKVMPLKDTFISEMVKIRRYLPATATPANAAATINYKCKLYSTPSTDSEVVCEMLKNDTITVLYTNTSGVTNRTSWAYVRTESGNEGFMYIAAYTLS